MGELAPCAHLRAGLAGNAPGAKMLCTACYQIGMVHRDTVTAHRPGDPATVIAKIPWRAKREAVPQW